MKQYEAVLKVMEKNGGFATLGFLYDHVFKIKECEWKTKTPFASIRRIVQDDRYFFKIKPGLWALKAYKNRLPEDVLIGGNVKKKEGDKYQHTYYQGLVVEIGNLMDFRTYVPRQDINKPYLGRKLGHITSIEKIYKFSFERFVRKAETVDISWFNERNMPAAFFEVDYTTDFTRSLVKFTELRDFNTDFTIISHQKRKRDFLSKLNLSAFITVKSRVKFIDYETLADWHRKTFEMHSIKAGIVGQFWNKSL